MIIDHNFVITTYFFELFLRQNQFVMIGFS